MLEPSKIAPGYESHEELFLGRYRQLRAWALQLTENDRQQAEDLVHDTLLERQRPNLISGVPIYLDDPSVAGGRRINRAAFSPLPGEGRPDVLRQPHL